jgi:hypothetical protein
MGLRGAIFVGLSLLPLSGCAVNWTIKADNEQPVAAPRKEQFGELITGPGQRVPIGNTPAPLPETIPTEPPKPIEPVKPGTIDVPPQAEPPKPNESNPSPDSLFPSIFPPHGPDTPLIAATRAFQDGRADFANDQLRWFGPVNQAVLSKLLPAAARTAAGPIQDANAAGDLLTRIEAAADVVRPFAELKIESLRLCDRVDDYGDYVPTMALHTGKRVVVYYEVENLIPEQLTAAGEPKFTVGFRAKVRVRSKDKVVEQFSGTFNRQWQRPVRDVFGANAIDLPATPGYYTLDVELIDTAGRRVSRSLEFRVDDRR